MIKSELCRRANYDQGRSGRLMQQAIEPQAVSIERIGCQFALHSRNF